MRLSGQSSWLLSRRITPPLKWIEWPPEPNNYFGSKKPPTLKSTHGSQRPRSMAQEDPHAIFETIPCLHFYQFYEKGTTWAMVGLQGLHTSGTFRCSNVLASMGLKSFCPWCLKMGGNTETITIHLREVHYRMAIVCNICQSFTSMNAQVVLEHHSGYKSKCDKEMHRTGGTGKG